MKKQAEFCNCRRVSCQGEVWQQKTADDFFHGKLKVCNISTDLTSTAGPQLWTAI